MSTVPRLVRRGSAQAPGSEQTESAVRRVFPPVVSTEVPGPAGTPSRLAVYAVVGTVSGLAAAVGAIWIRPPFNWPMLLLVAALVALLEGQGPVAIQVGRSKVLFSAKAYASIGAVYLLGPAAVGSVDQISSGLS